MRDRKCKFLKSLCRTLHLLGVNDVALGLKCEDYQKIRKRFDNSKELDELIIDREHNYFVAEYGDKQIHVKQVRI